MLEVLNVKKQYVNGQKTKQVIDGISFNVNKGDFISIMGPSGSGKSTLLYLMSGIIPCDSGTVVFAGAQLNKLKEKDLANIRKTQMGFVFQQAAFLKNLKIIDNILLPALNFASNKREAIAYAQQLMQKLGIKEIANRNLSEVSGGQLQRASICRALINQPQMIFADEPTGALNSKTSEELMAMLKQINQDGVAIVLVTHDRRVAAYADKVVFLVDGKLEKTLDFSSKLESSLDEKITVISGYMDSLDV